MIGPVPLAHPARHPTVRSRRFARGPQPAAPASHPLPTSLLAFLGLSSEHGAVNRAGMRFWRRTGPPVNAEIKVLVMRMAAANPLWGAPRIHGELLKPGLDVAERTVSRLLSKRRSPPSQTWRTFLANHVRDLVSIDFFTVPTARLRVLFVLVVLHHHRRRVVHFNVTEHPTAAWTTQQLVDAFPDDSAPPYLLRDRDSVYGQAFRRRVKRAIR